jgi:hypothetical protein
MSVTTTGRTVPRVPKAENLRLKALIEVFSAAVNRSDGL